MMTMVRVHPSCVYPILRANYSFLFLRASYSLPSFGLRWLVPRFQLYRAPRVYQSMSAVQTATATQSLKFTGISFWIKPHLILVLTLSASMVSITRFSSHRTMHLPLCAGTRYLRLLYQDLLSQNPLQHLPTNRLFQ